MTTYKERLRYCGAHIWAEWNLEYGGFKLYYYDGTVEVANQNGEVHLYHKFLPYRRPGVGLLLTDYQLVGNKDVIRPFLLDCAEVRHALA